MGSVVEDGWESIGDGEAAQGVCTGAGWATGGKRRGDSSAAAVPRFTRQTNSAVHGTQPGASSPLRALGTGHGLPDNERGVLLLRMQVDHHEAVRDGALRSVRRIVLHHSVNHHGRGAAAVHVGRVRDAKVVHQVVFHFGQRPADTLLCPAVTDGEVDVVVIVGNGGPRVAVREARVGVVVER